VTVCSAIIGIEVLTEIMGRGILASPVSCLDRG
jgi:hypothetical protein